MPMEAYPDVPVEDEQLSFEFERWRAIPGWEGLYEASSMGRIRSVDRTIVRNGRLTLLRGRVLRPSADARGYLRVALSKNGVHSFRKVHHLVLDAFVGPKPEGLETRHFPDNDRRNNRIGNISWGTSAENADDRRNMGTQHRGSRTGGSKLKEADIPAIRNMHLKGGSLCDIAHLYSVSETTIYNIVRGKTWRHV